jgi:hypothetical protein
MPDLADDNALIAELARDTVRLVAPAEMPLFRANSEAYFRDPDRALRGERGGDQLLGFGTGAEVVILTPVVLAITKEVVVFLAGEVAKAAKAESPGVIRELVKRCFKKFGPAPASAQQDPPLTRGQLEQVRQVALDAAKRLAVPDNQAALLADSVVGGLAIAK